MKKLIIILIFPLFVFGGAFINDDEQIETNIVEVPTLDFSKNQHSIQKSLQNSKNLKMILNIKYEQNKTYKVRTRQMLSTHFVFENDKIAYMNGGDNVGFKITVLKSEKYDFSNILKVETKIIGIDTNLFVIGESGNIYSFYIYSTDYKDPQQPKSFVFISENVEAVRKIEITDLEKLKFNKAVKEAKAKAKKEELKSTINKVDIVTIGEGINKVDIIKSEIMKDFTQKGVYEDLKAEEIFRDKKWTYFKYDSRDSLIKFPLIYRVIDGYDTPVNTRIVGNYIIAETVSNKFTLRLGNKYICVRRRTTTKED